MAVRHLYHACVLSVVSNPPAKSRLRSVNGICIEHCRTYDLLSPAKNDCETPGRLTPPSVGLRRRDLRSTSIQSISRSWGHTPGEWGLLFAIELLSTGTKKQAADYLPLPKDPCVAHKRLRALTPQRDNLAMRIFIFEIAALLILKPTKN